MLGTRITLFALIFGVILSLGLTTESISAEMLDLEDLDYSITGGTVSSIEADTDFGSLIVIINTDNDGQLTITLPRAFIDATIGGADDDFFVLADGEEVTPEEISTTSEARTFIILFEAGIEEIEIIGTTINVPGLSMPPMEEVMEKEVVEEVMEKESMEETEEGGGCLIATAAYGTELAPQVQFLREIRDNTVMSTASGTSFMTGFNQLYYSFSPTIADLERENPMFQEAVRAFITPMVSTLSIMTLAEDGSEVEVLGLGISVIALNLGMYIAAPAMIVWQIKKRI